METATRLHFKMNPVDRHDLARQRYTTTCNGKSWEIDNHHVWMATDDGFRWLIGMNRNEIERLIVEASA